MIISMIRNWEKIKGTHRQYLKKLLRDYYKSVENIYGPPSYTYFFLRKVHRLILSRSLNHYKKSIIILRDEVMKKNDESFEGCLLRELKLIVNYDTFSQKGNGYNAYALSKESKLRTCPYCNHSFSITIDESGRGFRPSLDHFYDKARYPHLGLSLYNLIPSCSSCNSSLKNINDFFEKDYLHPFFDFEEIVFKLSYQDKIHPLDIISGPVQSLRISIGAQTTKAKNSSNLFLIEARYQFFTNEARSLALAKLDFDEQMKRRRLLITSKLSEAISLRFDKDNYKNEMLGGLFKKYT